MIFSSSIHLPANDKISFFFMAEWNSIVYKYHIFFIHSSVVGHFGCFHNLGIPVLGIYSKEYNTDYSRGTCTPIFIAMLFTTVKSFQRMVEFYFCTPILVELGQLNAIMLLNTRTPMEGKVGSLDCDRETLDPSIYHTKISMQTSMQKSLCSMYVHHKITHVPNLFLPCSPSDLTYVSSLNFLFDNL
jgi:hypothetical protein